MRSEVQVLLDPPLNGALAQLGEHLLCKQGVIGSIPIRSTKTKAHGMETFLNALIDFFRWSKLDSSEKTLCVVAWVVTLVLLAIVGAVAAFANIG